VGFDLRRTDTICAAATPLVAAALAVVRVSGPDAHAVRAAVFRPRHHAPESVPVGRAVVGELWDAAGLIDEVVATTFRAPRSFTGEDMVELSLHGAPPLVARSLRALLAAGCRAAEPGEFTLRAVLSGRLDLAAAEAVDTVIRARTEAAAAAAARALRGGLRDALTPWRAAIVDVLAELEARLDFPDDDLGSADRTALVARLADARAGLLRVLATAGRGRHLFEGARVVLVGVPNAGKSSLLNALAGSPRALVHESPGTTRDVLEVALDVDGVPVTLVDTAGLRAAESDGAALHPVEQLGIERSRAELAGADVVLWLVPPGADPGAAAPPGLDAGDPRVIIVASKGDLRAAGTWAAPPAGAVVVATPAAGPVLGLEALLTAIAARLQTGAGVDEEILVQTARQQSELTTATGALAEAQTALAQGLPDEVTCAELRRAASAIARLLGEDLHEAVLDVVFSRFCIGK
jgi:tRNA modification GTPase